MTTIGFIITSHEADGKLARLVRALNREYDYPSIVIHHDFSQAKIEVAFFTKNVSFVVPWVQTNWAHWTVVEGQLRAFQQFLSTSDAEWVFLLSAADYPIRRGRDVRRELVAICADALIDLRPCVSGTAPRARTIGSPNPSMAFMDADANRRIKSRFMLSVQLWFPVIRWRPRLRIGRVTYRPNWEGKHPFKCGRLAFYGDAWWAGNRRAVEAVLNQNGFAERLRRHLRLRSQPDESYYCTVLANDDDLTLCLDNHRYSEWNGGGAHPKLLDENDLKPLFASGAFFARKFPDCAFTLGKIDAHLTQDIYK